MAITNQLILVRMQGSNDINAYNKSLDSTPVWTEALAYTVSSWVFDGDGGRDKLWTAGTDNYIRRYSISDTGLVEDTAVLLTTASDYPWSLNAMTIDENTGNCYIADGANHERIYKILVAGTAIDAEITYLATDIVNPTGINTGFALSAQDHTPIVYDPIKDALIMKPMVASTSVNPRFPVFQEIDKNLTTFGENRWATSHQASNSTDYSASSFYDYTTKNDWYNNSGMLRNKVTGEVAFLADGMTSAGAPWIYKANFNEPGIRADVFDANRESKYNTTTAEPGGGLFCGKYSGNWHFANEYIIVSYTPNLDHINHRLITNTDGIHYTFNEVTEMMYILDYNTSVLTGYDKNHQEFNNVTLVGTPAKLLCVPGTNDVPSNQVTPSSIVYPTPDSSTNDTTPTVVWKVNDNPTDWTQQFRVIADTDYNTVVNGNPSTVYDRAFDSWLNGTNYADCTWEYSTDYVSGSDPAVSGIWTALGTGDGLKVGGVNITNGVDANVAQYYVKMTVPAGSELTGGASNTKWYFNIFSYSAT